MTYNNNNVDISNEFVKDLAPDLILRMRTNPVQLRDFTLEQLAKIVVEDKETIF